MLDSINYILPATPEGRTAFDSLKRLFAPIDLSDTSAVLTISTSANLKPQTHMCLDPKATQVGLTLRKSDEEIALSEDLFSSHIIPGTKIHFLDIEKKLAGKIKQVDHTGLVTPGGITPGQNWKKVAAVLASSAALFDYPKSPEYDPKKSSWLFVVPCTEHEYATELAERRLRQPKFELVFDAQAANATILQIDIETNLKRDEIRAAFPNDMSYDLPGLGEFFRSINIASPWQGISHIRLDMRYKSETALDEWNSANWLIKNGKRLHALDFC